MDTILYLYPARRTAMCGTPPEEKAELRRGKLKKFLPFLWKKGEDRRPVVTVSRTEYFFPDYHLVRVSVARTEGMDKEQAELKLREQLQELTEDPDHTYVVCREPLSFYFGREFRDYLQQEWIEHLLRYGERPGGYPAWPDLVLLGRNPYLPYVVLRYAARLQSMKWYLTEREYREEEEWLTGELEDEYGLIPEIRLLAEKKLQITLSVSLHSPDNESRNKIMPINRRWNVETLLAACKDYYEMTGRRVSFEYTMIDGVSDSPEQAELLSKKLAGMGAHVNMIPLNNVTESGLHTSSRQAIHQFQSILEANGITATLRRTLGSDIDASCGQLRRKYEKT